jgi:hypothetical protein
MSTLTTNLEELFKFLNERRQTPPLLDVRLIEITRRTPYDDRGRLRIRNDSLQSPADYESRFEELMQSGLPWLNMSCYGVYQGFLIIGIELPNDMPRKGALRRPSVNYSGPPNSVIQQGWDLIESMVIE